MATRIRINFCLTPGKYYSRMGNALQKSGQVPVPPVSRSKPTLWLALAIALGLHLLILLLPLSRQAQNTDAVTAQIELQLTTYEPKRVNEEIIIPGNTTAMESAIQEASEPTNPEPESAPLVKAVAELPPPDLPGPIERELENMNLTEKTRLTHTILSSQFITEESVTEQIFGKPFDPDSTGAHKDFHYPERSSLVAMLDQPMQDLPFEYTPGLVRFAYAPGIKGDLQRFGDKITPEFGLITRYGTKVSCIWVLVIVACGWGRP